jgi:hypothetical protein
LSETTSGRKPITIVQIDQDFCTRTYGVAPCTASNPQNKCFNTRATCQDPANYEKGVLTLTFAEPSTDLPKDLNIIPSLGGTSTAPTRINPTNADRNSAPLGQRAALTVSFNDHPSSDNQVDPYVSGRNYDPFKRGTFWSKWLVRNPFYQNRPIRIYEGYVDDFYGDILLEDGSLLLTENNDTLALEGNTFTSSAMSRSYFIDTINGPDSNGRVQIVAKDPLKLADRQKAQVPVASPGKLRADIDETSTSIDIESAVLADYPTSGLVRIDDELISYTSRSLVTESGVDYVRLAGVVRATNGSIAEEHNEETVVQACVQYVDEPVWDVIYDLLVTYAEIDPVFIPYADWLAEGTVWLPQFNVSAILSEPDGVADVLNEILEQVLVYIWWDERDQEIKLQAIRPLIGQATEITDDNNIIANTVSLSTDPKNRVSQVWVYWGQKNKAEDLDKESNYQRLRIRADLEAESPDQYGESRIRKVFARWIQNDAQAINLSARLLGASYQNPKILKLRLDAKDRELWTADIVDVLHRNIVDFTGEPTLERYQILSVEEVQHEMQRFLIRGTRFGFYTASDTPTFSLATEEQLTAPNAWYADENGLMPDNSQGWEYQ